MHEMNCHLQRINRNIVECKDTFDAGFVEGWNRINRNIVECKGRWQDAAIQMELVLIETLWNVKGKRRKTTKQPTRY